MRNPEKEKELLGYVVKTWNSLKEKGFDSLNYRYEFLVIKLLNNNKIEGIAEAAEEYSEYCEKIIREYNAKYGKGKTSRVTQNGNRITIKHPQEDIRDTRYLRGILTCLEYALAKKEKEFNLSLEEFLLDHIWYWTKLHDMDGIPDGYPIYPDVHIDQILGVCAIAYDNGINITVKSEYLPEWIYKGEFGERKLLF